MATFVASPTGPENIATDPVLADDGIVKMLWRMRGMINNLGYTFKDVVDEQNKAASSLNNTFNSIEDWAIKTEDRLANLESRPSKLLSHTQPYSTVSLATKPRGLPR